MSLRQLQQEFIHYLSDGEEAFVERVFDQDSVPINTRLNIYANAYRVRLRETIDNDHPVLSVYLGEDLFDEMVAGFIQAHPSSTHSLRYFADQLPTYLAVTLPFAAHPVISELARFERSLLTAFDAEESQRATILQLQTLPAERWPSMRLRCHPSVQVFDCHWNSVEAWQSLKQGIAPPPAKKSSAFWLLWRNKERLTEFVSLSVAQRALLNSVLLGETFAQACEHLLPLVAEEEVSTLAFTTISRWIEAGAIQQIE